MIHLYRIIINIILLLSPIIITFRLIKGKEDIVRFKEKFCSFSQKRSSGKLLWFHGASVGEIMSIIPLIDRYDNDNSIDQILITSSTLSSSKIIKKYKFKKVIHQFFPIDQFYFTSKFINYWKPKISIFIDSEIWPCMYKELTKKTIPLFLLNARITPKSFRRWNFFNKLSKNIFENINFAYPANTETKINHSHSQKSTLKYQLSFYQSSKVCLCVSNFSNSFLFVATFSIIFCASSTHKGEENIIAKSHLILKQKYKNLLTVIIPRHINRVNEIYNNLKYLKLNTIIRTSNKNIDKNTDVYLVDTYGETKKFFDVSKIAFIGGSLIKHGGQNPIEPAKYGLKILHGPNVHNFNDIYKEFNKKKIAYKIKNLNQLINTSSKLLVAKKSNSISIKKLGDSILKKSVNEINKRFINEIKKT